LGEEKKKHILGIWKMTKRTKMGEGKQKKTHFKHLENDQKNEKNTHTHTHTHTHFRKLKNDQKNPN
jgi:hypothetical protein